MFASEVSAETGRLNAFYRICAERCFITDNPFKDLTNSHWAYNDILSAMSKGWISGYPDLTFRPDQNITRAETVKLLNGWLDRRRFASDFAALYTSPFKDLTSSHWAYNDIAEASNTHAYYFEQGTEMWK